MQPVVVVVDAPEGFARVPGGGVPEGDQHHVQRAGAGPGRPQLARRRRLGYEGIGPDNNKQHSCLKEAMNLCHGLQVPFHLAFTRPQVVEDVDDGGPSNASS